MAPDVNSLTMSPRSEGSHLSSQPQPNNASRRTSTIMPSPVLPAPTTGTSQVPMRHPRPLTAAELYAEFEKEQEGVVNRLTRELTALRAQSASVASNASVSSNSTSASLLPIDITDPNPTHQIVGATHPTPSRERSSSSVSSRGIATPSTSASVAGSGATNVSVQGPAGTTAAAGHGISQASVDRAAAAAGNPRDSLSQQPSRTASGRSTPARHSMEISRNAGTLYTLPHRPSLSRDPSSNTVSSTHAHAGTPAPVAYQTLSSPGQPPTVASAMQHYAETAAYRTEMEIVKAENEVLRQRVRALEQALRTRRRDSSQSDAQRPDLRTGRPARESSESIRVPSFSSGPPPIGLGVAAWAANDGGVGGVAGPRERSESQSTSASSRRALGVPEDDVRVGESASSVGLGRGV